MATTITYGLATTLSETSANSYLIGDQQTPDVTGLSNGGYVLAYNNAFGATHLLRLDFYDANSTLVGSTQTPYSGASSAIGQPSITQLANGNVLVIWDEGEASEQGIKGTLYSPTGTIIGSEISLTSMDDAAYVEPDVAALSGGGFVISYEYSGNIFINTYNDAGVKQQTLSPESISTGNQTSAVVTALLDGGFALAFVDDSLGSARLLARSFNADNSPRSVDPIIIDNTGNNHDPAIAAMSGGKYVIVYTDDQWASEGGTKGISMRIINADGSTSSSIIHVNVPSNSAGKDEVEPAVTVLENGYIVVSWTFPFGSAPDNDIRARIFDQSGNPLTVSGNSGDLVITGSSTNDIASAISSLTDGEFVAVWQDSNSDGNGGSLTRSESSLVRISSGDNSADTITGDNFIDEIHGGDGADILTGGKNGDSVHGDAGADQLWFNAGDILDSKETVDGGADYDKIVLSGAGAEFTQYNFIGSTVTSIEEILFINQGSDQDKFIALDASSIGTGKLSSTAHIVGADASGSDDSIGILMGTETSLDLSGWTFANWGGQAENVEIIGDNDGEVITGSSQNDTILSSGGNDTLIGGAGKDVLWGGEGDDRIYWDADDLSVKGEVGTDTLVINGGSAPLTFDLTVNTFELAEHSYGLTGGASERDTYNASWQRTDRTIWQADNSRTDTHFDPLNLVNTVQIDDNYNSAGTYVSQTGYYDAGGRWAAQFNIVGPNDNIYNYFDAANQLDYTTGRFDTGLTFLEDTDQGNLNDWTSKYAVNTAANAADYQYDYYDDGTRSYLDHDQNGTEVYLYQYTFYDASNVVDYYYGKYNDGSDYYFNL